MIKRCPQHGLFRGELCQCGSAGQVLLDDTKTEQLGRLVAGGLRHFPSDLGLQMDSQGWVDLAKLGQAVSSRHRWADKDLIIALIQSDSKQRYEFREDRVRA
ncbi:MAG TPA: RNA 2'-phosphotransferase, partial [Methanothrix sp.]|nr:RNA 2'-phosphotransferase [Methanothrix sp.]